MPAPSAIRQNTRYSGRPSREIEIKRSGSKHGYHQRSQSRSRAVPLTRNQTPRYFPGPGLPLERSRSNDSRYDNEYTRGEYGNDVRDNDDYSSMGGSYADAASAIDDDQDKPGGFGFSAKFFCCDSTMSWGLSLGKEDEETEQLEESEKNIKRGIIPHFPRRGRSLTRTNSIPHGRSRSLSKSYERRGRSHSRSRSLSGAIKGIMRSTSYGKRSASAGISPSRTRSWSEHENNHAHKVVPNQYEYFDGEYRTANEESNDDDTYKSNKSSRGSIKSSSKNTSSNKKKSKGLFSKLSRNSKKSSNKKDTSIGPRNNMPEDTDSKSLKSEDSDAKAEVERLKSQLEDLKKAEEERRRQAELLEVAMNATNEEEKRTFADAAALAAEAAAKALEDEETKRAAGALLAHQLEEERSKSSGSVHSEEEEKGETSSPTTAMSQGSTMIVDAKDHQEADADENSNAGTESGSEDGGSDDGDDLTFDDEVDGEKENPGEEKKVDDKSMEGGKSKVRNALMHHISFQSLSFASELIIWCLRRTSHFFAHIKSNLIYVLQVTGQVVIEGGESTECLSSGKKVSAEPESNNLTKQVELENQRALKEKKIAEKVSSPHPHVKLTNNNRISNHAFSLTHTHINEYQAAALERKRKEAEEKKASKKAAALAEKKLREEKKAAEKVRHCFV